MKIAIIADEACWSYLKSAANNTTLIKVENPSVFFDEPGADAFINFDENVTLTNPTEKPYLVNSVSVSLRDLNAGNHVIRFNGWDGFHQMAGWETSGVLTKDCTLVLNSFNKTAIPLSDDPGFLSPRVVAMIINEAYFAHNENVGSEEAIDIAMKLGTNYPYGPFQWASKIGIKNVYKLLKVLSITDKRYSIAPLLQQIGDY